jgi:hypothetical protein
MVQRGIDMPRRIVVETRPWPWIESTSASDNTAFSGNELSSVAGGGESDMGPLHPHRFAIIVWPSRSDLPYGK